MSAKCQKRTLGGLFERKDRFQSPFMLMTVQPFCFASSKSACVNAPIFVSGILGADHRRIRVFHRHAAPASIDVQAQSRPRIPAFAIAGRVAEGRLRTPADDQMDAFGFACVVVVQHNFGS